MQTVFVAELILVMFIACFKIGDSLKCYQCRSDESQGCESSNELSNRYLIDCPPQPNGTGVYCRKMTQQLMFKKNQDTIEIRECAYRKGSRDCYKFEWYEIARMETCECDSDSCNAGYSSLTLKNQKILFASSVWTIARLIER